MRLPVLQRAITWRRSVRWLLVGRACVSSTDQSADGVRGISTSSDTSSAVAAAFAPENQLQYISLYNYTPLEAEMLPRWRRRLLAAWRQLDVLGRVYIAPEGINAQVVVPGEHVKTFAQSFPSLFAENHLNYGHAIRSSQLLDGKTRPFERLHVRIRKQIVADGFEKAPLNLQDSGNALPPDQWHHKLQQRNTTHDDRTLVLDVRNFYEHEVGRFDGATRIMVDTFRDTFDAVDEILENHAAAHDGALPREVMMYCTGGIRCEKVGAYLKQHKGIDAIHKLAGGIVQYQRFLKDHPEEASLFKGRNFVFDQRCVSADGLAEDVTSDVLGECFQCGEPCNDHTNCSNLMCGGLILQCASCRSQYSGACSDACKAQTMKMQTMDQNGVKQYRKMHAQDWMPVIPNALSGLRRIKARSFSTSALAPPLSLSEYVYTMNSPLADEMLLKELRERTIREWPKAEQLIDEPQSQALSFLVQLTHAKDVLEIGCFTGYSAVSLANGLVSQEGCVTTCDVNADTMQFARSFFERSSRKDQIRSVVEDGMTFLNACANEKRQFDFIFVDANKRQYINYYDAILEKKLLRDQGLLVFDNTLFRGRVLAFANGDASKKERIASSLAEFNLHIRQDERTVCVLLPLWDGLTLVRQRTAEMP